MPARRAVDLGEARRLRLGAFRIAADLHSSSGETERATVIETANAIIEIVEQAQ